jgi:hypothetical protein
MLVALVITEELGRLEDFFSEFVYPAWPLWLAVVVVAAAVALVFAYRLGWHRWAVDHRFVSAVIIAAALAIALPTGWYTVSPLFERETVCEASPLAGSSAGSEKCEGMAIAAEAPNTATTTHQPAAPTPAPTRQPAAVATPEPAFQPNVVDQGEFQGADDFHFGRGQALLIETAPDTYTVRFENFSVRNGPDLFVYLSTDPEGYSQDALLLGELKGTDGAFNYDVPTGTDVSKYRSAVVWCKAFSTLFATATFA